MGIRQKDVPPEVWEALMQRGIPSGSTIGPSITTRQRALSSRELIEPSVVIVGSKLVVGIPVATYSDANERKWQKVMQRKISAKRAVRETIGPNHGLFTRFAEAYHAGKALCVCFRRVGHRRVDRSNLPTTMKYVEDTIAAFIAADDGDPRWRPSFDQDPDHDGVGVVVEIEVFQ